VLVGSDHRHTPVPSLAAARLESTDPFPYNVAPHGIPGSTVQRGAATTDSQTYGDGSGARSLSPTKRVTEHPANP